MRHRLAVDQDLAAGAAQHAEQRQQQFALALAVEAAEARRLRRRARVSDTPLSRGAQVRLRASSTGVAVVGLRRGLGGKTLWYSRPIISSTTSSSVLRAGLVGRDVAAVAEHRAVVGEFGDLVHAVRDVEQRDALVAQPLDARRRRVSTSAAVSAEVASSRIRTRGLRASALAISTICRRLSGRSLTSVAGMDVAAAGALRAPPRRGAAARARSIMPKRVGGLETTMLSATDRSGISDSSWKMQTMPAALAAAGSAKRHLAGRRAACGPRRAPPRRT